tara:strand:- start:370 stop:870 length:501 start_codon:yes stop_codon:yes gene_type:complete
MNKRFFEQCRVIASIQPFEKLSTQSERFNTYPPGKFVGIMRYWNRESRESNISDIDKIIDETLNQIENLLANEIQKDDFSQNSENLNTISIKTVIQNKNNLNDIKEGVDVLNQVIIGLENLKQTYVGDSSAQQRLQSIIIKLNGRINSLKNTATSFSIEIDNSSNL